MFLLLHNCASNANPLPIIVSILSDLTRAGPAIELTGQTYWSPSIAPKGAKPVGGTDIREHRCQRRVNFSTLDRTHV